MSRDMAPCLLPSFRFLPNRVAMKRWIGILGLAVLALTPLHALPAQPPAELFFYSPEFAPDNLGVLKKLAEDYLRSRGVAVRFQAFARFEDFRSEFDKRDVRFAILPPWAVDQGCAGHTMLPLARPVRAGSTMDRKTLIVGPTIRSVGDLRNASVAVTDTKRSDAAVPPLLAPFIAKHRNIRVIAVPKDVDALLAVSFGQVEAAFVSTAQFETLTQLSPTLTSSLREIGFSVEAPFPLLYAAGNTPTEDIDRFVEATRRMSESDAGQRLLRLLGYDQWQEIPAERRASLAHTATCPGDGKEASR